MHPKTVVPKPQPHTVSMPDEQITYLFSGLDVQARYQLFMLLSHQELISLTNKRESHSQLAHIAADSPHLYDNFELTITRHELI
jgi:hypothetical protein